MLCLAEVDLLHARIARDLGRRAFGEELAPDHDGDALGEAKYQIHVVLDEKHGDIARQRNQNATAAAYYDQILKQDRNHVPTLMSRGDMYWESGNRILAVALYRRATAQLGTGDPQVERAARRIEEFEREVGSVPRAAEPPPNRAPGESAPSEPAPSRPAGEAAPSEIPPIEPPSDNAPSDDGPSDEPPAAESPQDSPVTPTPPATHEAFPLVWMP